MTDRELLERAARAAGLELGEYYPNLGGHWCHTTQSKFDPLNDDADAFRLMVACRLLLQVSDDDGGCTRALDEFVDTILREMHVNDDNENAATRRAIVRAAAEMGENK